MSLCRSHDLITHRIILSIQYRSVFAVCLYSVPVYLPDCPVPPLQTRTPSDTGSADGRTRSQREIIAQLEAKNQEMMRQIARLRASAPSASADVELVTELTALRQRRGELESHLSTLQDSRRQLMGQLDSLMKMLKVWGRGFDGDWVLMR